MADVDRDRGSSGTSTRSSVPAGAELLAGSDAGPQAFRLRRNLGLQFHPEADRAVIEAWFADDIDQVVDLVHRPGGSCSPRRIASSRRRAASERTAWSTPSFGVEPTRRLARNENVF